MMFNFLKTIVLFFSCLMLAFSAAASTLVGTNNISDFIKNADLILHVKLTEKSSKEEMIPQLFSITNRGEIELKEVVGKDIYTTFNFEVLEVFSGAYNKKSIEVKMSGGCDEQVGLCVTTSLEYDYSVGDYGVIFLHFDPTGQVYYSYAAKRSAFKVGSDNKLFRGESEPLSPEINATYLMKSNNEPMTVDNLKHRIYRNLRNKD